MVQASFNSKPIPARAGVGLKPEHYEAILTTLPKIGWFEIIPENYMAKGGAIHHYLEQIRSHYPLSMHGIGLSLGAKSGVSKKQLHDLKGLKDRYQPGLISEHLSWSGYGALVLNDLLPLPYTDEVLETLCNNINETQNFLQQKILIENPSSYFQLDYSRYTEAEFMVAVTKRSGADILLDVNNVYVSAKNHGFDPFEYINSIPSELIGEIHLAGHSVQEIASATVLIDDHGSAVIDDVWSLYKYTLERVGERPTLIEWDSNIPDWSTLFSEAQKAERLLAYHTTVHA